MRGSNKGREGKVATVYRLKHCIYVQNGMLHRRRCHQSGLMQHQCSETKPTVSSTLSWTDEVPTCLTAKGQSVSIPIDPSKVEITKLKLDKVMRCSILTRASKLTCDRIARRFWSAKERVARPQSRQIRLTGPW